MAGAGRAPPLTDPRGQKWGFAQYTDQAVPPRRRQDPVLGAYLVHYQGFGHDLAQDTRVADCSLRSAHCIA